MKEERIKKKKEKKSKTPFDFKIWMREVLQSSSKKNAKTPKINAIFKVLIIECLKNQTQSVIQYEKDLGGVASFTIFSGYSTRIKNLIYSPKKEVDIVLSLVDSSFFEEEKINDFCFKLKQQGINDFYIYSIKPTSADLNLIYLLQGV